MQVEGNIGPIERLDVQAVAVAVFKDEKPNTDYLKKLDELSGGLVNAVIDSGEFSGKEGETSYLHLVGNNKLKAQRLLLVGVGAKDEYDAAGASQMSGTAVRSLRDKKVNSIAVAPRSSGDSSEIAAVAVEGAFIAVFDPDKYRTVEKENQKKVDRIVVVIEGADAGAVNSGVETGRIIGESINFTRDMANEPGAYMTPSDMAERAREVATEFGLSIDVLDEARMEQEGMGSLLSVSRGSEQPAKLIILKYTPPNVDESNKELLSFVGKGVTFDSGGISLKPGENMELMKYDMTGGATVIGTMRAIAQLKPPIPILGVAPCTENLPSGKATKPGDVVRAMTGKTIEVINTDAEGRLILADAMAYAKKLGATKIIDMATLTGAVSIALGDVNAAVLGTDQPLIDEIISAGREVGEKFWQLPLDKEYSKQIKSDIADIKNVGGRKAGTITAAAFLKEFADGVAWAHLDIAGTAWGDEAKPYRSKGPTGIAVRTLLKIVERASAKK